MVNASTGELPISAGSERRRHPLARGIELLTLVVDSDQDLHGVRELASKLEVSPSTVHRLVTDLQQLGLLSRASNGSYRLGLEFMRLAWTTVERYPLQEASADVLHELTEQSGESSFFAVYGEAKRQLMFSLTVESPHPLRYSLPQKQWIPLHAGASGLAILAHLPDEDAEEVIDGDRVAFTSRTIQDVAELRARVALVAREGYSLTRGERIEGALAIAAPVFGPSGTVVGSIGISMPEVRFSPAYSSSFAGMVKRAAGQATAYLTGERDLQTGIPLG
ncbi:MAG: IclR family transcriptional regulator [Gulosibacter sp.]